MIQSHWKSKKKFQFDRIDLFLQEQDLEKQNWYQIY